MKKLSLLFMVLFLGSCTVVYTPHSDLITLIGGKSGTFTISSKTYGFTITDDATSYLEVNSDNLASIVLPYIGGSGDFAHYEGIVGFLENGELVKRTLKISLTELDATGGKYTANLNGIEFIKAVDFTWVTSPTSYTSVLEAISQ